MGFLTDSTHFHIFTWVVGIILFLVAAVMANGTKGKKITHMISRLFYVLILISGVALFIESDGLRKRCRIRHQIPTRLIDNRNDGNGSCTFSKREESYNVLDSVFRLPFCDNVHGLQIADGLCILLIDVSLNYMENRRQSCWRFFSCVAEIATTLGRDT